MGGGLARNPRRSSGLTETRITLAGPPFLFRFLPQPALLRQTYGSLDRATTLLVKDYIH
jgi:hypothetical protein